MHIRADNVGILRNTESMEIDKIDKIIKFSYVDSIDEVEYYFKRTKLAIVKILEANTLQNNGIISIRILIFSMPLEYIFENLYVKIDEKLQNKIKENEDNEIAQLESNLKNLDNSDEIAFSILSGKGNLAIKRANKTQDEIIYKAIKLISITQRSMQGIRLLKINKDFVFKDASTRVSVKEYLESSEFTSKYLDKWDEYAKSEGKLLLEKARGLGEVEILKFEKEKKNMEIIDLLDQVINELNNLDKDSRINLALVEFKNKVESNPCSKRYD